ncbi:type VI secretion system protein TssA [Burkholderia sp. Ac-20379]|uniref:type VI secretion system protein TssA n=1 Tax=Burkholderia sp. Ac-20379 TaxID=2703900 RepID=UPI0019803882|nr:type VI secretion system protein TssA [Burkholderia sp. Ac-20379]MBN3722702.1 type VI secretion system protein TssA [Burkholderia sp. Ac-20379]
MTLANFVKTLVGAPRGDSPAEPRMEAWAAWLVPLGGEHACGRDPGYEDAFFELKDEANKLSGIDDGLIARFCEQLLKETGKDLRLAGYYAFARLRMDRPAGFADGIELAALLVDRFGEAMSPARAEAKRAALDMFATARMLETLDGRGEFAPADAERVMAALDVLVARTNTWSEAARPNLQPLVARFQGKDEPVRVIGAAPALPLAPASASAASGPIASARDLLDQARAMSAWLRDQENGYLPSVRVVRSVRWDTLHDVPPSDAASHTRLVAPRAELRQQMKRLVLQKQWHALLERVEGAFMEGANHLWFDLQYFQHIALDHIGAPHRAWSDVLRADFALFLARLPGIERLAFNDGTPFADDATLEWIARHAVVRDLESGETVAPLPVSAHGEGETADWPEIEAQARDLAGREGLEAALAWLDALPGMKTARHGYLQRLVMARLAEHAGRPDAALALLAELDTQAGSLPLIRWEPALIFEVKQQLVRALKAASHRKEADKPTLARRIAELHAELTVLDPARALTLS